MVSAAFVCIWCEQRVWPVYRPDDEIWSIDPAFLVSGQEKPLDQCSESLDPDHGEHEVLLAESIGGAS